MDNVDYERAKRVAVAYFSDHGIIDVGSQFLSNLFDIAEDYVRRDLVKLRADYLAYRKAGGRIKAWENGEPLPPCEDCKGTGWMFVQTVGHPDGDRNEIQRCQQCEKFKTDEEAIKAWTDAGAPLE